LPLKKQNNLLFLKIMEKKLVEELKERLEKEKKSLEKELEGFAKKDDSPKGDWETKYPNRENGTMEEEADEVQEYGNMLPVEHSMELKLRDVNAALEKIKNGNYGVCEKCGKEIEIERLKAVPEAKFCMEHNGK
jgi:DnaK suppressor protein